MGKVMTAIQLANVGDQEMAARGLMEPSAVRVEVVDGLVDTGATSLAIPADVVARLGLRVIGTRDVRVASGERHAVPWIPVVSVTVLGRETCCEAVVLPAGTPTPLGQIPLEALDLVVDPKNREVRVNPESPEAPLLDLLAVA